VVATLTTLDFNDPAVLADPYPSYARLRAEPGIPRSDTLGWLIARHADVSALLHDRRLANGPLNAALYDGLPAEALAAVEPFQTSMTHNMLLQDAPEHTRLRRLVSQAFTPRRIQSLRGAVERITLGLLDGWRVGEPVDVIADLAFPLPARVIATMLGVPWDDLDRLRAWNDDGTAFLGNARTTTDPVGLAERTGASTAALLDYFAGLAARHRAEPGDDLICDLIAIEEQGERLTEDELLSTCGLLFAAGHETTTNAIGNGLLALLRHPDQWALLREQPDLWPVAVEELIRFDSPVQLLYRVALERVDVGELTIAAGDFVTLLLGSANRDAAAFPDPDRLDLRRRPRHYLSFGTGPHACLGAFLARLETEVALSALLARFPGLALVDEPLAWHPNPIFRGVERLRVIL
jgi:cytochrome P450